MTGELEITVVHDGEPAKPLDLVFDLIRCARTLAEETGWVPPALLDTIEKGLELAGVDGKQRYPFGEEPAGVRR